MNITLVFGWLKTTGELVLHWPVMRAEEKNVVAAEENGADGNRVSVFTDDDRQRVRRSRAFLLFTYMHFNTS